MKSGNKKVGLQISNAILQENDTLGSTLSPFNQQPMNVLRRSSQHICIYVCVCVCAEMRVVAETNEENETKIKIE